MKNDPRFTLREAWPQGFLAIRGLRTIRGWQCLGLDPTHHTDDGKPSIAWASPLDRPDMAPIYWHQSGADVYGFNVPDHIVGWEAGDFLPAVTRSDFGCWNLLLEELAGALLQEPDLAAVERGEIYSYQWYRLAKTSGRSWVLNIFSDKQIREELVIPLREPSFVAERALVLARISVREAAAKEAV